MGTDESQDPPNNSGHRVGVKHFGRGPHLGDIRANLSRKLLTIGLLLLVAADLILALTSGVAIGVALWGLHMGFSQGLLYALVADAAPAELRGAAYGMLNLLTGVALLAASIIAGILWDATEPQATFLARAGFAALTLSGLLLSRGRLAMYRAS